MCGAARGQSFPEKWPYINYMLNKVGTNFVSMGIETGTTGRVVYQGDGVWGFYFPVAGIVTNTTYFYQMNDYLNVLGGLLGLNGSPTGTTRYITLSKTDLTGAGFLTTDYFPAQSWAWAPGLGYDVRIKGYSTGLKLRNYADDDWRDLQCRNLFVWGTQTIANVTTLDVATNKMTMNSGWSGPPLLDAWLGVNRGSEAEARVRWNEATDTWEFGTTNAMYGLYQIYLDATSWTNWWATNTVNSRLGALEAGTQDWDQAATAAADWTNWWGTHESHWISLTNDQAFYNSWTGSWSWVVESWSNSAAYGISGADTREWHQAVTDAADWTNWWAWHESDWTELTNATVTNVVYSLGTNDSASITGRTLYVSFNTNSAGGSAGGITNIVSTSGGTSLVYSVTSDTATLKGLKSGTNVTLSDDGTNVTITSSGGGGGGASTNIAFSVYNSAVQTITKSVYGKWEIDTEFFDVGGHYNLASNRFEVPVGGVYSFFIGTLMENGGSSFPFEGAVYTNGTQARLAGNGVTKSASSPGSFSMSCTLVLNTGDLVECYIKNCDSGSNRGLNAGGQGTYFEGHLVSVIE